MVTIVNILSNKKAVDFSAVKFTTGIEKNYDLSSDTKISEGFKEKI